MTGLLLDFYCALVRPYAYIPLHGDGDGNGRGSEGHCGNYATNYGSGNGPGIPSLSISLLCLPLVCLKGRYQVYVVAGIKCMWCKLPVNILLLKRIDELTIALTIVLTLQNFILHVLRRSRGATRLADFCLILRLF